METAFNGFESYFDEEQSFLERPPTSQPLIEATFIEPPPSKRTKRETRRHSSGQSSSRPKEQPKTTCDVNDEAAFRDFTGIGEPMNKKLELDEAIEQAQYYNRGANSDFGLNKEFEKFRARIKKNLFRMQPVRSLSPEAEPLIKDLFNIFYSFVQGKKTANLDSLLVTIGHKGLTDDDLQQKKALGDVLVKLIDFHQTGTNAAPILLPIFIDNLFKEEKLKLPAISMTYFMLHECLPIENSAALLRLLCKLAAIPMEFIEELDKGFRFSENVLDSVKKLM